MEWTKLMAIMNQYCINKKSLYILWETGLLAKCKSITGAFETDNGLDADEEGYLEYYAATVEIQNILQTSSNEMFNNKFIEISSLNKPTEITDENSILIWSRFEDNCTLK